MLNVHTACRVAFRIFLEADLPEWWFGLRKLIFMAMPIDKDMWLRNVYRSLSIVVASIVSCRGCRSVLVFCKTVRVLCEPVLVLSETVLVLVLVLVVEISIEIL